MFDHQISRFEKRIADLPDQPTLAPDALKAWFDSAPEQLRQALNRVCADGKTLEERMESLVIGAYGGTVTREMLAQELQQEIAGKAEQSAVQASLSALSGSFTDSMQSTVEVVAGGLAREFVSHVQAMRKEADFEVTQRIVVTVQADAETNARVDQLFVFGTYEGDGETSQFISLGFTPRAVLICRTDGAFSQANLIYGGLATAASPAKTVEIAENGFNVLSSSSLYNGNNPMYTFKYIALR